MSCNSYMNDIGCPNYSGYMPQTFCHKPSTEYLNFKLSIKDKCVSKTDKPWIDDYALANYEFGWRTVSEQYGITNLGLLPLWMVNTNPEQTPEGSNGWLIKETNCYKEYVEVKGQRAYQYAIDANNQRFEGGNWLWGIGNASIVDIDADKILNYCKLFQKATVSIVDFQDVQTGLLAAGNRAVPIVVTEGCKLVAILNDKMIRSAVIPRLLAPNGNQLWTYNVNTDEAPVMQPDELKGEIAVKIDGQTVRANGVEGVYYGGTNSTPLTSHVYVNEDLLSGNGTPANVLSIADNSLTDTQVNYLTPASLLVLDYKDFNYSRYNSDVGAWEPNVTGTTHNRSGAANDPAYAKLIATATFTTPDVDGNYDWLYDVRVAISNDLNAFWQTGTNTEVPLEMGGIVSVSYTGVVNVVQATKLFSSRGLSSHGDTQGFELRGSDYVRLPKGTEITIAIHANAIAPNFITTWDDIRSYEGIPITAQRMFTRLRAQFLPVGKLNK